MDQLEALESQSVFILREAYRSFKNLVMLWSIGKDSTVLLWLARKAFFGHVPLPLMHIDTMYKIPQMIEYRNRFARDWNLNLIVGKNSSALAEGQTFPDGRSTRLQCCKNLKSEALKHTLSGEWPRWVLDHSSLWDGCPPDGHRPSGSPFFAHLASDSSNDDGTCGDRADGLPGHIDHLQPAKT